MKNLLQKTSLMIAVCFSVVFAACTPEIRQSDENIDSATVDFYSPAFTFSLKSYLCSQQLLASGSDGSRIYLDGTKCMELGHYLLCDNAIYGVDTIWAKFNPANDAFVVSWEIAGDDPSAVEIVEQNAENNYIIVKGKKLGNCEIIASINNKAKEAKIETHVMDVYATGMTLQNGEKTDNYTIYINSPVESRTHQVVSAKVEQVPGWEKEGDPLHEVQWSSTVEGIVELDTSKKDTCDIKPLRVGTTTVVGKCEYRTVNVIVTVKENMVLTAIDSLVLWTGTNDRPTPEFKVETLWLSVGIPDYMNVQVYPEMAKKDYPEGYKWEVGNSTIAEVETPGGPEAEYQRKVTGKIKGETTLTASMGIPESEGGRGVVSESVILKVCNLVSGVNITAGGSTALQTIYTNETLALSATIENAAAATEFGSNLKWHCDSNYLNISDAGVITPVAKTPEMGNTRVWATLKHPKFPGRAGNTDVVSVTSNEILVVVKEAAVAVTFTPTSCSYDDDTSWGWDFYENIVFSDGTRTLTIGSFDGLGYIPNGGDFGPVDAVFNDGTGNKSINGTVTITPSGTGYIFEFNFTGDVTLTGTSGVIVPDVTVN